MRLHALVYYHFAASIKCKDFWELAKQRVIRYTRRPNDCMTGNWTTIYYQLGSVSALYLFTGLHVYPQLAQAVLNHSAA